MVHNSADSVNPVVGNGQSGIEVKNTKTSQWRSTLIMQPIMLTVQEARKIANNKLVTGSVAGEVGSPKIIDDQTIDKSYAWIFYYDSEQQTQHRASRIALASNGAIFVSKRDGHISIFAPALTLDEMIENYEESHRIWKLRLPGTIRLDPKMRLHLKRFLGLNNIRFGRHKTFKKMPLTTGSKTRLTFLQNDLDDCGIPTELVQNKSVNR